MKSHNLGSIHKENNVIVIILMVVPKPLGQAGSNMAQMLPKMILVPSCAMSAIMVLILDGNS